MKQASSTAFTKVSLNAGVLLKSYTGNLATDLVDSNIICATRGGATLTVNSNARNISVDGMKTNTVESYVSDGFTATLAFTALTADKEMTVRALGCADIDTATGKVMPRHNYKASDFANVYWVGERADGVKIVCYFGNTISTGGLSWKTNDKGELESSITLTANYTANDQDTVPFWMNELVTQHTITVTAGANGSVSPASITVASNSVVTIIGGTLTCDGKTITATADSGYQVGTWTGITSGQSITENKTVTVSFTSAG